MLFLVDGYNVTLRDPATALLTLAEQRNALVSRLRVRGRSLLGSGRIVVVFDGKHGFGVSAAGAIPVEVVFSRGRIADDEIVRIAKTAADRVVLISADRDLAARVAQHAPRGFEVRDPSVCFEAAKGKSSKAAKRRNAARDSGQPKNANAITKELKDLWLSEEDR
ncbi:MAG: NYN domain-containing protein [Coriobacteriia bacterium]